MEEFRNRIKLTPSQRKEIQSYLKSITATGDDVLLKIVRKLKELERKLEDKRYE